MIGFIGSKLLEKCVGVPIDCIVLLKKKQSSFTIRRCRLQIYVLSEYVMESSPFFISAISMMYVANQPTHFPSLSIIFSLRVILFSTLLLCLMFIFLLYPFSVHFVGREGSDWKTTKLNGERKTLRSIYHCHK